MVIEILPVNPARTAGTLGKEIPKEMDFWTKEEYLKFAEAVMDKPVSYAAEPGGCKEVTAGRSQG